MPELIENLVYLATNYHSGIVESLGEIKIIGKFNKLMTKFNQSVSLKATVTIYTRIS